MEVAVLNTTGKDTGKKVKLPKSVFEIEPNDHAIYLDVKRYLAAQRQGTHKSKQRAEITGSTRKIKKQKGSGTARAGSIKSPLFRGGGRAFGPEPRDYSFKLNKKVKQIAKKSALTYKAKDKNIAVVETIDLKEPKTKLFFDALKNLSLDNSKSLIVVAESNSNLYLSSRNIPKSKVVLASDLNTYDIMNADKILLEEKSVEKIEGILS